MLMVGREKRFSCVYHKFATDEDKLDSVEIDGFFSLFQPQ
tara:strand:- start:150 stop:269 length:120 start_codon:yes stop_codon:yes gene_type:complete